MVTLPYTRNGFTLIELLVVLAIVAVLLTLAVPRYFQGLNASKEAVLVENLHTLRDILDKFYGDTGRYPENLDELVEKNYLRRLPQDPITESTSTWVLVAPQNDAKGSIYDIKSGAVGKNREGRLYSEL